MTVIFKDEIAKDMNLSSSPHNVHDHLKCLSISDRKDIADSDRLPFAVGMINILGDLNTCSIIRSAHIFGASEVFVFGRNKIDHRATVGAEHYTNIVRVPCQNKETLEIDPREIETTLGDKYFPVFIEQGGTFVSDLSDSDCADLFLSMRNPCFIFGNETRGIPENILTYPFKNAMKLSINQRGVIRSLNVGVAAGVVLHDITSKMKWI